MIREPRDLEASGGSLWWRIGGERCSRSLSSQVLIYIKTTPERLWETITDSDMRRAFIERSRQNTPSSTHTTIA